jgi:VIT1/CCC1 family predicted Fe2+/Mn2+ transporter
VKPRAAAAARYRGGVVTRPDRPRRHRTAHPDYEHRDVQGGAARAAVFGVSDGLVSNMGLILGVAGADPAPSVVRLAGLAGLVSGAISMAAGEYNSMRVQSELLRYELAVEARSLEHRPEAERDELAHIYELRGLRPQIARKVADALMRDPETALEAHAREELGIDPHQLGSPLAAGTSSFAAFSLGGLVPLVPWFVVRGMPAVVASVALGIVAACVVGLLVARATGGGRVRAVVRQVLFTLVPAAVTYLIGSLVGVGGV